jgi:hypothetical protein
VDPVDSSSDILLRVGPLFNNTTTRVAPAMAAFSCRPSAIMQDNLHNVKPCLPASFVPEWVVLVPRRSPAGRAWALSAG